MQAESGWAGLAPELVCAILDRASVRTVMTMCKVSVFLQTHARAWIARHTNHPAGCVVTYAQAFDALVVGIFNDDVDRVASVLISGRLSLSGPLAAEHMNATGSIFEQSVPIASYIRLNIHAIPYHKCVGMNISQVIDKCSWTLIELAVVIGAPRVLDFLFNMGARYSPGIEPVCRCDVRQVCFAP